MRAILAVILAVVCLQPSLAETSLELNTRGVELYRRGKYPEAEKHYRTAIAAYKQGPIDDAAGYASTLNNLAGTLQTMGKVNEARQLLTEAITYDSKIDHDDPVVTHAMNNLALLHQAEGEYPKAIALLQRALQRAPHNGRTRGGTLHNLAAMYYDMGQNKKATELFEQSVEVHKHVGAVEQLSPSLTFLARLAAKSGDRTRAAVLLDRALALRREFFGPVHPLVALSISDIAEFHREDQRYEQASTTFKEALGVLEVSVGHDHLYAAPVLFHYAENERLRGLDREALDLYRRSIRILETTFGPAHVRLAIVYKGAAMSAAKLKHKEETKEYTTRAKMIERGQIQYGRHTIDVSSFTGR